jgi:hypothetical protein
VSQRPVKLSLSFADLHILRALMSQGASPGSFQSRFISDLDAALAEATRNRFERAESAPLWGRSDLPPAA